MNYNERVSLEVQCSNVFESSIHYFDFSQWLYHNTFSSINHVDSLYPDYPDYPDSGYCPKYYPRAVELSSQYPTVFSITNLGIPNTFLYSISSTNTTYPRGRGILGCSQAEIVHPHQGSQGTSGYSTFHEVWWLFFAYKHPKSKEEIHTLMIKKIWAKNIIFSLRNPMFKICPHYWIY